MMGTAVNRNGKVGSGGSGGCYFYFSFYFYFTAVCPWTEELS